MPTLPATTNAPVIVLVDVAVLVKVRLVLVTEPPTNNPPNIPAPPTTCSAPVLVELLLAVLSMTNVAVVPVELLLAY